jgi:hypothetical protein
MKEETLLHVQVKGDGVRQSQDDWPEMKRLLEEARLRAEEERNLSSTTENAHYAAASLGQPPYVSLPGVGIVMLRRGGWSC